MTTTFNAAATKTVGVNATNFEFTFTRLERIAFGPGKITTLGAELERMGATRALVATGKTLGASPLLERVTAAMGLHCAGVFAGVGQHVPASSVRALVAEAERVGADALVAFGGGSPIDACKVAAASLLNRRDMTLVAGEIDGEPGPRRGPGDPARRRAHHALCRRVHARRRGHRRGNPRQAPRVRCAPPASHRHLRSGALPQHAGLALGCDWDAGPRPRARGHLFDARPALHRHARRRGDPADDGASARFGRRGIRPSRRARLVPDRRLALLLRWVQYADGRVARAWPQDRTALGRAARRHLLHHLAARHALHGRRGAAALL